MDLMKNVTAFFIKKDLNFSLFVNEIVPPYKFSGFSNNSNYESNKKLKHKTPMNIVSLFRNKKKR